MHCYNNLFRNQDFSLPELTPAGKINFSKVLSPALPVVLGYLPIGFAYGVLAANTGLTIVETMALSLFVFAGSSQLIAVALFAQGIHPLSIVLTTLIVNLRHLLMSASLSSHMKKWKKIEIAGFCYELTDETFAVHSLRFNKGDTSAQTAIAINLVCQVAWIAGSLLGALAGKSIADVKLFALDYALPAMFIALLLMQVQNRSHIWVALLGGALSIGLWGAGFKQLNVILAAIVAATLGAILETNRKSNSTGDKRIEVDS
jgi:4-azaleucine resistance transporter AzlC